MTTRTTTLRALDMVPGIGNDRDGVPFRWLTSLVERVRAAVPDDEEGTCKAHGVAGLTFTFEHTLTPMEQVQADLDALQAKAAEIRAMLPRSGSLNEEETNKLRELLG